jgi:hypothetical protein
MAFLGQTARVLLLTDLSTICWRWALFFFFFGRRDREYHSIGGNRQDFDPAHDEPRLPIPSTPFVLLILIKICFYDLWIRLRLGVDRLRDLILLAFCRSRSPTHAPCFLINEPACQRLTLSTFREVRVASIPNFQREVRFFDTKGVRRWTAHEVS